MIIVFFLKSRETSKQLLLPQSFTLPAVLTARKKQEK
jgi:hypothetical protein